MIVETGHLALALALAVALLQATLPMIGAQKGWADYMRLGPAAATAQFILLAVAFIALTQAFLTTDLSVKLVAGHSHELKPLLYKIAGVWGNHEGSMLLWALTLALFGALIAWFGRNLPLTLRARTLSVQGMVGAAFLAFILFTSNPFWRFPIGQVPFEGADLNPVLQDPGLAFHPPFLYLGYVGLSTSFSFAVAALIEGRVDAAWARWVRPWTLAAWVFLTIGIGLGSWWAYYELGWGGFWFWDPVENASFMPWLIAAALVHSAIVVEKREALKSWTILLAILAFGFSLIGTFIVRSGVLTSVHAFANDPERGVYILAILAIFMGGALLLFALRAGAMEAKGVFSTVSRESGLVVNNLLLAVSTFVVFIGTIWPLLAEMFFDRTLSVGPPFFNAAFTPFVFALAVALPIGAMLPWKRAGLSRAIRALIPALVLALACGLLAWAMFSGQSALAPIGVGLSVWLVAGAAVDLWSRTGQSGGAMHRIGRMTRLPRADWGKAVAHAGVGVTMFGVVTLTGYQVEDIRVAREGEPYRVGAYEIELLSVEQNVQGPNYISTMGHVAVREADTGRELTILHPERRIYPVAGMPTTEAGINNGFTRDVYLTLGDPQTGGGWALRTWIKPFANWIWGGTIIMALGGFLSLSDRRYRVAAGARKAPPPPGATGSEPKQVPAE
jgi:cytochrome c-type biogenesis protein CcmF